MQVNLGRSPMRNGPTTLGTRVCPNSADTVKVFGGSETKIKTRIGAAVGMYDSMYVG